MKIYRGYTQGEVPRGMVLGMGVFDGVHLGHQEVIREVIRQARSSSAASALLTFHPHPLAVVGGAPPPFLYTPEEKEAILAETGLEILINQPFDSSFAALSPEAFVEDVLARRLAPGRVVVGHDFRFGRGGAGDVERLEKAGLRFGFAVTTVGEVLDGARPVRSSRIRDLISGGEVEEAARLLGRPYHLTGTVVAGKGLGKKLGFPTANLSLVPKLIPPKGVYAGEAKVAWIWRQAAINIGFPHGAAAPLVECHVLDYRGDLGGGAIAVRFLRRLRDEMSFGSHEALAAQIARDVDRIRETASSRPHDRSGGER